ncbi:hypothetical protein T265_03420 [Opisthorchis viverrini]|uniref:Uncharacterized protein n=1 Tax=Opisthorchis viverrini TaxID=6198 RepID=A0A074ZSD4_OPIVI|nr:hypothetical protein T265_03420 [Opisthorchis viverrini]KER30046.1 hypothetical protein T265_03420 [Opisthorchis viverrini]
MENRRSIDIHFLAFQLPPFRHSGTCDYGRVGCDGYRWLNMQSRDDSSDILLNLSTEELPQFCPAGLCAWIPWLNMQSRDDSSDILLNLSTEELPQFCPAGLCASKILLIVHTKKRSNAVDESQFPEWAPHDSACAWLGALQDTAPQQYRWRC